MNRLEQVRRNFRRNFIFALLLLVTAGARAEPVPAENPPAVTTDPSLITAITTTNGWHTWHRLWSSNVVNMAEYIDDFFADPALDKESNDTRLKLSLGAEYKDGDGFSFITRANFRLSLPGTSKRLKLFYEDLVESEEPGSANEALRNMRDNHPDAGIRVNLRQKRRYSVNLDGGYRTGEDQFFARIRGRRDFNISDDLKFRLVQSATYYTESEWVSKTEFDINVQLPDDLLFRSESDLEWAEDIEGVRPTQVFVLFKPLSSHRAVRYQIGGDWPESPGPTETRYFTSVTYRKRIHSDWIYFEVEPGVEFPQLHDYEAKSFVKVKFDFVFGKVD